MLKMPKRLFQKKSCFQTAQTNTHFIFPWLCPVTALIFQDSALALANSQRVLTNLDWKAPFLICLAHLVYSKYKLDPFSTQFSEQPNKDALFSFSFFHRDTNRTWYIHKILVKIRLTAPQTSVLKCLNFLFPSSLFPLLIKYGYCFFRLHLISLSDQSVHYYYFTM